MDAARPLRGLLAQQVIKGQEKGSAGTPKELGWNLRLQRSEWMKPNCCGIIGTVGTVLSYGITASAL